MHPRFLTSAVLAPLALLPAACASSRPDALPASWTGGSGAIPLPESAAFFETGSGASAGASMSPSLLQDGGGGGGGGGSGGDTGGSGGGTQGGGEGEIVSSAPRALTEETRIGYDQPEWTSRRRFARTRIYVLPEGQWELEQWWRATLDHGESPTHRYQTEIGVGLPGRFQFDLYGTYDHEDDTTKWVGLQPELRWAPADWGEIPLNPTIYLEYKINHDATDVAEGKLLFGEELGSRLHWGMNFSVEQQLGDERECEFAITEAISYSAIDQKLGIGIEFEYDRVTAEGSRDDEEHQFYLGPSIQWRPTENMHVDIVPLRGWHDAHDWRIFVVLGWDFGGADRTPLRPVSSKSR